jgi:hypothetical protein
MPCRASKSIQPVCVDDPRATRGRSTHACRGISPKPQPGRSAAGPGSRVASSATSTQQQSSQCRRDGRPAPAIATTTPRALVGLIAELVTAAVIAIITTVATVTTVVGP